jgi:hypothetical protein
MSFEILVHPQPQVFHVHATRTTRRLQAAVTRTESVNFRTEGESRTGQRLKGVPDSVVSAITRKFGEARIYGFEPMAEGLRLNVRDHQGAFVFRAVQAMFEPLHAPGPVPRQTVNVFEVTTSALLWRWEPFAFDGQQLLELVI